MSRGITATAVAVVRRGGGGLRARPTVVPAGGHRLAVAARGPRRARPRRRHRQADDPTGRARSRRRRRRSHPGDARGAQRLAAGHPGAARHRRRDPVARRQRRLGAGGPGLALVRPERAPSRRWPGCCGPAADSGWCGTPATNGWAGSRISAASSATSTTRSATRSPCRDPFTDVERHQVEWTSYLTPQALIDLVASRSYCITSPDRGAHPHARRGARTVGHPPRAGQHDGSGAAVRDGGDPRDARLTQASFAGLGQLAR